LEVANLLGCQSPDPEAWRKDPLDRLARSITILSFLAKQLEVVRSIEKWNEQPKETDFRTALILSIETLIRTHYDIVAAEFVLNYASPPKPSPLELLADGRVGSARKRMIGRVTTWLALNRWPRPDDDNVQWSDQPATCVKDGLDSISYKSYDELVKEFDYLRRILE
jgi:hypothetical protein